MDNTLSIHFGKDKSKSILFVSKHKIKVKSHRLGCILNETTSIESMALKVINIINSRLNFLHRKNKYSAPELRRLLYNALMSLFNLTLIMYRQLRILTLPINEKTKSKSWEIYGFGIV